MIVVAIIGILAAIAIPQYQDYTIKSQAMSALSELSSVKIAYDAEVADGVSPSLVVTDVGYIGLNTNASTYCNIALVASNGGVECVLKSGNAIKFNGNDMKLLRTAEGVWSCTSNLDTKYKPKGCS